MVMMVMAGLDLHDMWVLKTRAPKIHEFPSID